MVGQPQIQAQNLDEGRVESKEESTFYMKLTKTKDGLSRCQNFQTCRIGKETKKKDHYRGPEQQRGMPLGWRVSDLPPRESKSYLGTHI